MKKLSNPIIFLSFIVLSLIIYPIFNTVFAQTSWEDAIEQTQENCRKDEAAIQNQIDDFPRNKNNFESSMDSSINAVELYANWIDQYTNEDTADLRQSLSNLKQTSEQFVVKAEEYIVQLEVTQQYECGNSGFKFAEERLESIGYLLEVINLYNEGVNIIVLQIIPEIESIESNL